MRLQAAVAWLRQTIHLWQRMVVVGAAEAVVVAFGGGSAYVVGLDPVAVVTVVVVPEAVLP